MYPEEETEGSRKRRCVIVDGLVREGAAESCLVSSVVDLNRIVVVTSCRRRGSMTSQSGGHLRGSVKELRAQVVVGLHGESWSDEMRVDGGWASEMRRCCHS